MDKEKEIEEMAKALYAPQLKKQNGGYGELCGGCRKWDEDGPCKEKWHCHFYKSIAEHLHNAGYGNVKQAVKEFAEKLKQIASERADKGCLNGRSIVRYLPLLTYEDIDNLIKELYGDDQP